MVRTRQFDVEKLVNRCGSEPGKILKRNKMLGLFNEQPKTVSRDIGNFNLSCAFVFQL